MSPSVPASLGFLPILYLAFKVQSFFSLYGKTLIWDNGALFSTLDFSTTSIKFQSCNNNAIVFLLWISFSTNVDFLPLTVDYREKFAAAGKYPGGFFKREARPSSDEILTMRLVDRVLRPLFPKDYHNETQVMIQLMSHDEDVMPDALAGLAASAAIQLSDIPFETAISEVKRTAYIGFDPTSAGDSRFSS